MDDECARDASLEGTGEFGERHGAVPNMPKSCHFAACVNGTGHSEK